MIKLSLIAALLCVCVASFGQDVNEAKFLYCEIVGTQKMLSPTKVTIDIDFGDEKNVWKDNRVREEETGKVRVFNSMVDALNYMGKQGWEFVQAYAVTVGNQNVYHYLLKRPTE